MSLLPWRLWGPRPSSCRLLAQAHRSQPPCAGKAGMRKALPSSEASKGFLSFVVTLCALHACQLCGLPRAASWLRPQGLQEEQPPGEVAGTAGTWKQLLLGSLTSPKASACSSPAAGVGCCPPWDLVDQGLCGALELSACALKAPPECGCCPLTETGGGKEELCLA